MLWVELSAAMPELDVASAFLVVVFLLPVLD